jgi:peptide/nickel transport system permease protein
MRGSIRASATREEEAMPTAALTHDALAETAFKRRPRSFARDAFQGLIRNRSAVVGAIVLGLLIVLALAAPLLSHYDPTAIALRTRLQPPDASHVFGTDEFGRDILTRVLYGARISLPVGLIALAIGVSIGTLIGLIAGFYSVYVDAIIMWAVDVMLAFPGLLLALLVVAVLGVDLRNVMIAVGVSMVPRFARLVRGTVLSAKENLYVDAARTIGVPEYRILVRHILPNIVSPVIVLATLSLGVTIITAAGLSFIGLGAKPPSPEWGAMVAEGRQFLQHQWWIGTFPGIAVLLTVLSVNLIGDGLRDALDPRQRM